MVWSKADVAPGSAAGGALRERLVAAAHGWGIDRIGIASAADRPPAELLDHFLAAGFHAGMDYLARRRAERLDPASVLPGVKSIICCALSYLPGGPEEETEVRLSRYARGPDYHGVIKDRLHGLLETLRGCVPDVKGRVVVDTAPLLERYWAEQAGLGWVAHNGCLIVPGLGSWVFLGELLLDIELPAGRPPERRCGTCRRCLEACPNGALVAPGRLDARRCIAYWTVEHRGDFPPEAPPMAPWLFGCDLCQEVCPWNRRARSAAGNIWGRPGFPAHRTLGEWLALTPQEYERHYGDTPMRRAGYAGLMRNVRRLAAERDWREP